MARTLVNISELSHSMPIEKVKVLSYTEELEKINKIKFNLSFLYFAGFAVGLTTLFL
ncbi:MAG: hypothetical protein KDC88_08835 [Ignavibacteriae bacterium]|nr:hypothetical protein [Ignavibacteriota bacterium]MCB9207823.1 hypothetical protein [Ignavibacteriales bacterium]MCB9258592.1 hypothetical protein [Ignavibacteriales bacterium]